MASTPISGTGISTSAAALRHSGFLALRASQHAFSLLELMVVVTIIGIMAGMLVLSSSLGGEERIQEREAHRLSSLLTLLREEALMQNRDYAVEFTETGYRFLQFDYNENRWLPPLTERIFVDYNLPEEQLALELNLDGRFIALEQTFERAADDDGEHEPQVMLLSSGEVTPFELEFVFANNNGRYRLDAELDGSFEVSRMGFNEL